MQSRFFKALGYTTLAGATYLAARSDAKKEQAFREKYPHVTIGYKFQYIPGGGFNYIKNYPTDREAQKLEAEALQLEREAATQPKAKR